MGSLFKTPKPPAAPPPAPVPKSSGAMDASAAMEEELRRKRASRASTFLTPTNPAATSSTPTGGTSFLG